MRRLSHLPVASKTHRQFTVISRCGHRITTSHILETTVVIIDLHSQAPPQFIDTDFTIRRLTISGNVLVVMGSDLAAGWLLTEEGTVDGVFDYQRASISDSKWTFDLPPTYFDTWDPNIEGVVGVFQTCFSRRRARFCYHIETGDGLNPAPELQYSSPKTSPKISTGGELHHQLTISLNL